MPKFLRIGVHQSNVSGYTSKAWAIRRVGMTVFLKWGAVEVLGVGDVRKIYWTIPPREKTIRCRTVERAQDYVKNAIARRRSHSYTPLSGNILSRRPRANRGSELEQALATILFIDIVRSCRACHCLQALVAWLSEACGCVSKPTHNPDELAPGVRVSQSRRSHTIHFHGQP
jgi:hypothetical protein